VHRNERRCTLLNRRFGAWLWLYKYYFPNPYCIFILWTYFIYHNNRTKNGRGAEFLNQNIVKTLKTKEAIGDISDEKLDTGNTADRKSSFRGNAMYASVLTD
jgi:hypothetical protein